MMNDIQNLKKCYKIFLQYIYKVRERERKKVK